MENFEEIKLICKENSRITSKVVDEFLIYYAAQRNNLEVTMDREFARYRHITADFPNEWVNLLKSQYIAHRIFRGKGFIRSFSKLHVCIPTQNDRVRIRGISHTCFFKFHPFTAAARFGAR